MTARTAAWGLAAAVVAAQVPYPLVHGDARDVLTVVTVVVFAAASVVAAMSSASWPYAAVVLVGAGVIGFAAEAIGVHSGVPFGDYRYLHGLGAKLADVPVVVPFAWVMMAHPAAVVARRLASPLVAQVGIGALALASWDVFLDPQMVDAHHWHWLHPHPHLPGVSGVPLSNFGGWLLVSLVVMAVLQPVAARVGARHDAPATALWLWTWASSTLANVVFFGRPGVALAGAIAMGLVGVPLLGRLARS